MAFGDADRPRPDKAEMPVTFCRRPVCRRPWKETAEELLRQDRPQLAEEYSQLWRYSAGCWTSLEILGDTELTGEEFARLLRLVLTQYSVGTIPATLDQVKVSGDHPQRPALGEAAVSCWGQRPCAAPCRRRATACWSRRSGRFAAGDILLSDAAF